MKIVIAIILATLILLGKCENASTNTTESSSSTLNKSKKTEAAPNPQKITYSSNPIHSIEPRGHIQPPSPSYTNTQEALIAMGFLAPSIPSTSDTNSNTNNDSGAGNNSTQSGGNRRNLELINEPHGRNLIIPYDNQFIQHNISNNNVQNGVSP